MTVSKTLDLFNVLIWSGVRDQEVKSGKSSLYISLSEIGDELSSMCFCFWLATTLTTAMYLFSLNSRTLEVKLCYFLGMFLDSVAA